MSKRIFTLVLLILLLVFQAQLWLGRGSINHVSYMGKQLADIKAKSASLQLQNSQLKAEVEDLKGGMEMVEEKARSELGMIKPDEIFVHVSK